jgi:hypothetical protein
MTGVLDSAVTGSPALNLNNATGSPALNLGNTTGTIPSGVTFPTGHAKLLWRNSTGSVGNTHSTSWVYMNNQILGTVPTTTNYLLMEVSVRYRIEYHSNGIGVEICLDNSGSAPSTFDTADTIIPANWSSLDDTNGYSSYMMSNINPDGPAYTAIVDHYAMTFMFDGSSQFHASTNYVYLAAINMTASSAYTRCDTTIHSVTMWEIQK